MARRSVSAIFLYNSHLSPACFDTNSLRLRSVQGFVFSDPGDLMDPPPCIRPGRQRGYTPSPPGCDHPFVFLRVLCGKALLFRSRAITAMTRDYGDPLQPSACVPQPRAPPPMELCCKQRSKCNSKGLLKGCRRLFSPFFRAPIPLNFSPVSSFLLSGRQRVAMPSPSTKNHVPAFGQLLIANC